MNNRNWIAVFLGLACLVLFVSVMGASGNWLNGNNNGNNNGATPQQINQTVRDMNTVPKDGNMSTEIDANKITDDMTGNTNGNNDTNKNTNDTNRNDNSGMELPNIIMPQMQQ